MAVVVQVLFQREVPDLVLLAVYFFPEGVVRRLYLVVRALMDDSEKFSAWNLYHFELGTRLWLCVVPEEYAVFVSRVSDFIREVPALEEHHWVFLRLFMCDP